MSNTPELPRNRSRREPRGHRVQRETLMREIQRNEELLCSMVEPTAAARLALEARGVRIHLQENVLRADRHASTIITERLDAVLRNRGQNRTLEEHILYNREVIRTIRIFQLYRRFQQWQATQLIINSSGSRRRQNE